jgi:hypothetical protein
MVMRDCDDLRRGAYPRSWPLVGFCGADTAEEGVHCLFSAVEVTYLHELVVPG